MFLTGINGQTSIAPIQKKAYLEFQFNKLKEYSLIQTYSWMLPFLNLHIN